MEKSNWQKFLNGEKQILLFKKKKKTSFNITHAKLCNYVLNLLIFI